MKLGVEELKQPDDHRGLTVKQWVIVAATAVGAIFWVFIVSPQSNYWDTTRDLLHFGGGRATTDSQSGL